MTMRYLKIFILLFFVSNQVFAQQEDNTPDNDAWKSENIYFLTDSLLLRKPYKKLYKSIGKALKEPEKVYQLRIWDEKKKVNLEDLKKLPNLKALFIKCQNISELIPQLGELPNLRYINIMAEKLDGIGNLQQIKHLTIVNLKSDSIPSEIGKLTNLEQLELICNQLKILPTSIGNCHSIKLLNIYTLESKVVIPQEIKGLKSLRRLWLSGVASFPSEIGELTELIDITINNSSFTALPQTIENLQKLGSLSIYDSELSTIPVSIRKLQKLQLLSFENTKVSIEAINQLKAFLPETGIVYNKKRIKNN